ncbi:MAG TPA: hypothetical protein VD978_15650 [Azospirillum sp.]|nr:hypothetical protein [Azospirillum sp.]
MTMTGPLNEVAGGAGTGCRRCGASLLLAVLLLGGCPGTAITPNTGTIQSRAVGRPGPMVTVQAPYPKVKPSVRAPVASQGGLGVAMAAPAKLEPDALMGLDERQTKRLLGNPAAMEDETPAKVWHYANGACTLKVFFFMDLSSQDFRALSYDVKSSEHVPDVDQRCFAQLLAQAGNGSHE